MQSLIVEASAESRPPSPELFSTKRVGKRTVVHVGSVNIGAGQPVTMAGPCSVESYDQLLATAEAVKCAGSRDLARGCVQAPHLALRLPGPRSRSPANPPPGSRRNRLAHRLRSSQHRRHRNRSRARGHAAGRRAQHAEFRPASASGTVTKTSPAQTQPGSNGKGVAARRGVSPRRRQRQVVLCERGIRSYDPDLRNTLDLAGMALARQLSHLPVIADPSHATGRRDLIPAMCRAALAAGADGLIIEVHPDPDNAVSDGKQSLDFPTFAAMMETMRMWSKDSVEGAGNDL